MGVWGGGGAEGPKIGMLVGTGSSRRTSILGDFGSSWVGVWWGHVGRRLASQGSIPGPCWTHVGACWVDLGSMLASVGATWGPGRRLMGREGVCIDVLWANVELIVGVAGPNLAGWAVAWRQVGRIWPKVG